MLDIQTFPDLQLPKTSKSYYKALKDLFDKTVEVPGNIVELGVARGRNSAIFCDLIISSEVSKGYFGFDTFTGYMPEDITSSPNKTGLVRNQKRNRWVWSEEKVYSTLDKLGVKDPCTLVTGDLKITLPNFLSNNNMKVSLLYVDCNAYLPAIEGMRSAYPYMQPGAVICIDEHVVGGETKALKDFAIEQKLKIIAIGDQQPHIVI